MTQRMDASELTLADQYTVEDYYQSLKKAPVQAELWPLEELGKRGAVRPYSLES